MATRADYRTDLNSKILAIENSGDGDFDFDIVDLNLFLEIAVARLYPSVYRKVEEANLPVTEYGTNRLGYVEPEFPDRVFLCVDSTELTYITGLRVVGTRLVNIDMNDLQTTDTVTVYYHDAYSLPDDDVTDAGIPAMYKPLIILGSLIEAIESRQDTGIRGDPLPINQFHETQLLDRLIPRYERLKDEMAMGLPAVAL